MSLYFMSFMLTFGPVKINLKNTLLCVCCYVFQLLSYDNNNNTNTRLLKHIIKFIQFSIDSTIYVYGNTGYC